MTVQEQLLKAAEKLNYDDDCGGRATSAFRGHLELIAKKAPELEAAGFTIDASLSPHHMGGATITLSRNGVTTQLYSMFYDRYSIQYGGRFFDEKRRPLENLLEIVLLVAKMFTPPTA